MKASTRLHVFDITFTATITALMIVGKWALAGVANIEIVTLLIAVFASIWAVPWALIASVVFVTVESLLWGFGTWSISYILYWPLVAGMFCLLGKHLRAVNLPPLRTTIYGTILAVVLTAIFGVITSLVDVMIGYSSNDGIWLSLDDVWSRFAIMYARGIVYFVIHIVSNCVLFATAYYALCRAMHGMHTRLLSNMQ